MVRSTPASPSQLSMAYFPEGSDVSFDIPSFRDGIIDSTLRAIPADDSCDEVSFQIPVAANSSNLLGDNDFLRAADALATPFAPAKTRAHDPLTLSQLTPKLTDSPLRRSPSPATPSRHQRNTPKFKPTPSKTRPASVNPPSSPFTEDNEPRGGRLEESSLPTPTIDATSSMFSRLRAEVDALTRDADGLDPQMSVATTSEPAQAEPLIRSNSVAPIPAQQVVSLQIIPTHVQPVPTRGAADRLLSFGQQMMSEETSSAKVLNGSDAAVATAIAAGSSASAAADTAMDVDPVLPLVHARDPLTLSQLSPIKSPAEGLPVAPSQVGRATRAGSPTRTSGKRRRDPQVPDAAEHDDPRARKKGKMAPAVAVGTRARKPAISATRAPARAGPARPAAPNSRATRTVALTRAARVRKEAARPVSADAKDARSTDGSTAVTCVSGSGTIDSTDASGSTAKPVAAEPHVVVKAPVDPADHVGFPFSPAQPQAQTTAWEIASGKVAASSASPRESERSAEEPVHPATPPPPPDTPAADQTYTRPDSRSHVPQESQSAKPRAAAKLTVPVEFNFTFSSRSSTRKVEHSASFDSRPESSHDHAVRPVPDFEALHAAHAATVAARKTAAPHPIEPAPFELRLEARAKERERFEEARRHREEEAQRLAEDHRRELEAQAEREYQEARRRAIPKANPVPDWYRDAPKRKRE